MPVVSREEIIELAHEVYASAQDSAEKARACTKEGEEDARRVYESCHRTGLIQYEALMVLADIASRYVVRI